MENLYRKKNQLDSITEEELKTNIRVVPSSFWILAIGAILVIIGLCVWTFTGFNTTTTTITGVYHPGASGYGEILCFPSVATGKVIEEGMTFRVDVVGYSSSKYGTMSGTVSYADDYITNAEEIYQLVGDTSLTNSFYSSAPVMAVVCKLDEDSASSNGYKWTRSKGENVNLPDGTIVAVTVVISKEHPSLFGY